jgi:hypothetical protein
MGEVAAAAIEWVASGSARPPRPVAELSTADQRELYRAAYELKEVIADRLSEIHGTDPER